MNVSNFIQESEKKWKEMEFKISFHLLPYEGRVESWYPLKWEFLV
jgi:hypothetical protein